MPIFSQGGGLLLLEEASVSGDTITAGGFVTGLKYEIVTTGTTDFTIIGAADSNPGTTFTATGAGTGTGTAKTVATQSFDFNPAVDGENDGAYQIRCYIENDQAGQSEYRIRINGADIVAANRQHFACYATSTSVNNTANLSFMTLNATGSDPDKGFAFIDIPFPVSTAVRKAMCRATSADVGTNATELYWTNFTITNPAGAITSLGVGSSTASGLGIGSIVQLYRQIK